MKALGEEYGTEVDFEIVGRAANNETAREMEQGFVDEHFDIYNDAPPKQKSPLPTQKKPVKIIKGIFTK